MQRRNRVGLDIGGVGRTFDIQPITERDEGASVLYELRCATCRGRDWVNGGVGRADLIGFVADTGEWMEIGRTIEVGGPEWEAQLEKMAAHLGVPTEGLEFEQRMRGVSPLHHGEYWTTIGTRRGIVKVLRSFDEWPDWGSSGIRAKCRRRHRVNVTHEEIQNAIAVAERTSRSVLFL